MNKYIEKLDQWTRFSHLSFPVPAHSNQLGYSLGGITLLGFILLFISGLFMTQFIDPQPDRANQSLHYLVENVTAGAWIRSYHYWAAQAVILSMCLHMLRVFISGAYKSPRILTWFFGVALFFTTVFLAYFSGTVIKWDQEAYEALAHYEVVVGMLGPLGDILGSSLTTSVSMNMRVYVFHIVMIPFLLIALIMVHFYLVHVFNISPLPKGPHSNLAEVPQQDLKGDFLAHFGSIIRFSLIFYGLIGLLAIFVPAPLEGPPDVQAAASKPAWIYFWQYGIENFVGIAGILYSAIVLLVLMMLVPFIDRGTSRDPADRKTVLSLGGLVAAIIIGFTLYAWIAPPQDHVGDHGSQDGHNQEQHMPDKMKIESQGKNAASDAPAETLRPRNQLEQNSHIDDGHHN